jgi:hypothetical protein
MQFVVRASGGDGAKAFDPIAIGLHRVDLGQGFALRHEACAVGYVGLATLPAQRGFASVKKSLGVVKGGHGFSLKIEPIYQYKLINEF